MFAFLFGPLAGGLLSLSFLSSAILPSTATSIPFEIRGAGVRFVDNGNTPDNIPLVTSDNAGYFTTITLGQVNFSVILDTGSSDLWVNLKNRQIFLDNSTNLQVNETFGKGSLVGAIQFADLKLGDFTVQSQAFVSATETQDLESAHDGILGMSTNNISSIWNTIARNFGVDAANAFGNTPMPSLFLQQPNIPRNFDVALSRADGLNDVAPGVFLIGEHDQDFQQVENAPQLPSVSSEHWTIVMDAMTINGQQFAFNASRVPGVPEGKVAAALDTGFSLPPLPPPAVDAIYSTIPGAAFSQSLQSWIVPCSASANVSFVFGGQEYLVHPLDVTTLIVTPLNTTNGGQQNATLCINSFQYLTLDPTEFSGFDLILGDAFLRNVYASFNYADDFQNGEGSFVQLLSTTPDANAALNEFTTQRAAVLAQLPPEVNPADFAKQGEGSLPAQTSAGGSAGSATGGSSTSSSAAPTGTAKHPNGAGRVDLSGVAGMWGALAVLACVLY
ncbi:acid protease [Cubamyces lactineus]|nr:acid protease [Cubamyces lactineus]